MTLDRRTCEHQKFETYPADEFVYCESLEKCEFQCKSMIGDEIYCDKPVISHHTSIEKAARKDEREKLIKSMRVFCAEKGTNWAYDKWSMEKLIEFVELNKGES